MKKIAVMLPIPYKGGSLRAAQNIARAIAYQVKKNDSDIEVVFSHVKYDEYDSSLDFSNLLNEGISLRETEWKVFPQSDLKGAASLLGLEDWVNRYDEFCLPVDGAGDFNDCDLWLIISNRLPAPLFPLKKNAFIIYDFIERYIPDIFVDSDLFWESYVTKFISSLRHAERIFVTTPSTRTDLINFSGIETQKIRLLEMDFQPLLPPKGKIEIELPKNFILWPTNTSIHKNPLNALHAYAAYRQELGGIADLVVTGTNVKTFDPRIDIDPQSPLMQFPHMEKIRKMMEMNEELVKHIHFMGILSDPIYAYVLSKAQFLWHPTLYDNGTFAVLEAAYLGIPSLSAQYPAMEYIDLHFDLHLQWFNPHHPDQMAKALKEMEKTAAAISLPRPAELDRFNWKNHSSAIYNEVRTLLW